MLRISENKISILKLSVEKNILIKRKCLIKWSIKCNVVFLVYISNFAFISPQQVPTISLDAGHIAKPRGRWREVKARGMIFTWSWKSQGRSQYWTDRWLGSTDYIGAV